MTIDDTTDGLTFEEKNGVKTVKSGDHKFKYDFNYDVINGGKLTMTEIIPVTFNANGGKFANFTAPDTEKKIVKEVEYGNDLTDKAEDPTKDRETFKGWATSKNGTPLSKEDFEKVTKNIKEAKTFYAIWDNNEIKAEELTVHESFKDGTGYVNAFIPSLDTLKGQVKIKDAKGVPQPLTNDDKLQILDDSGNPIADTDLKDKLYEKLKEDDGTEVSRKVTLKAKVTHANGTSQTVDIPIKVIKNIYEAKTKEGKPTYVPDDYVKVTVDPTTKAEKPQKYFYYVNPDAKVVIPGEDPVGTGNNQFTKWLIKGTKTEYKLSEHPRYQFSGETTIEAQYVSDVIPQKGDTKPEGVPDNFVEVKFVPTDKATDETKAEKIFWVNPEKEVTIPVANPVGKTYYTFNEWKIGDVNTGETYKVGTPKQFKSTTTITATYTEAKNIIPYDPSVPDPMVRPEGYVRVTFAAEKGLKLTEQKAYYVKKNAGIILGDKDLVKPAYKEETGYKFDKWDQEDTLKIETTDIVVTAKATKLDNVIPEKDDKGKPNEKPKGYKEVTFVIKDGDEAKGSIDGVAKFYVNPTEYVTINPPATTANTGFKFGAWDKDATIPTVYDKDATITGSFNGLKDIIPKTKEDDSEKPEGYVKVTFELEKLDGKEVGEFAPDATTVYYVNPNKDVYPLSPTPITKTGYKFKGWTPQVVFKKYSKDTTFKGSFEKLPDIIPGGPEIPIPKGYVTVTFLKGENGKDITGQTVYYVNPKAVPTKKLGDESIVKPTVTPEIGYTFVKWSIGDKTLIENNLRPVAEYKELPDVIPKDNPTGGENDKPEGYITVTFVKGEHGKELTGQAVYYVNPNKAVVLKDKAPTAVPNAGYKFGRWDVSIDQAIQYKDGAEITALYNDPGNISTTEVEGYVKVEFKEGDHGSLEGTTNYWIKPGVEVNIPAPTVKPNVGYKFDKWDKGLTVKLEAKDSPYEITAGYTDRGNIIPQKNTDGSDRPEGYHTVTFKSDANGSLSGDTVVYVKPNTEIDLTHTADAITKKANVGYTAEGGTWSPVIAKQKYEADAEYTFTFKALNDVIEKTGEDTKKPDGYVTVKVVPTDKATDKTEKTYYVNPTKEVTIPFAKPTGKNVAVDESNPKAFKWIFTKWTSNETPFRTWTDDIKAKFTDDTTIVTANYEKSITDQGTVIADEITVHESFKDGSGNWVNNFIDTEATETILKGALKVNGGALPNEATVQFLDDEGNPLAGDALKAALYDKLKEKDDGNNPSRVEKLKAKVIFKNGEVQEVEIPIKVIKNIYEAKTNGDKPNYVPDGYVKVTVEPTTKAKEPQKYTYYVNPEAKVLIPGKDPTGTGDNKFVKWTSLVDGSAEGTKPSDFDLAERHQFEKATTITAQYVSDVIPQEGTTKPDTVPEGFVEVKFVPTDKATDETKADKIFWINPDKAVTISVKDPVGKQYFTFKEWKIGDAVYKPGEAKKFTEKLTIITATYTEAKNIIPYDPNEPITKPDGYVRVTFAADPGLKLTEQKAYYVKKNAGIKLGNDELKKPGYEEQTGYKFDKWDKEDSLVIEATDIVVTAKATELDPVIPEKDDKGNPNKKPDGYITVKFSTEKDGKIKGTGETEKIVYVNPDRAVVLKGHDPEVTPNTGFTFADWNTSIQSEIKYHDNDVIRAKYNAIGDVIPQEDPNGSDKPEGYLTVTFNKGDHGELSGRTVYYVKPNKEVTVPAPTVTPATGYVFKKWDKALTQTFAEDTTITAQYGAKPADPRPTADYVFTEQGVQPKPQDYKNAITPPAGKRIKDVEIVDRPNVDKPGKTSATIKVIYEDNTTDQINVPVFVQKKDTPTPDLRPYPVPGDCNNACEQPNQPNVPNQPNQPNVGKDALNTTDHYQYLIGYPDGNFAPNKGMTRAEAATMFTRLLNERPIKWRHYNAGLSDIRPGDWYANTVGYAVQRGIVSGYPDGSFKPNKPITRAEFAAIASRFDALAQGNAISFSDLAPSHWGYNAIRSAATKGWISGYPDNTFRPEQAITRAEVTAITNRMLNRHADLYWIDAHPSEVIRFGDVKRSDWYFEPIMEATMGHDFIRDRDKKTEHWTGINGKSFI
ncbi:S-layer homology domain-containing protein [Aedoeadaptatus coli]|uniref:S-layer homology domain-containing protein n=1 Tax=Aedoeadaptatus coli TaxID=2058292 RepID=UPI00131ED8C2|nr:S-layer homology domain-containing protein [Peptoniphilus coli]